MQLSTRFSAASGVVAGVVIVIVSSPLAHYLIDWSHGDARRRGFEPLPFASFILSADHSSDRGRGQSSDTSCDACVTRRSVRI